MKIEGEENRFIGERILRSCGPELKVSNGFISCKREVEGRTDEAGGRGRARAGAGARPAAGDADYVLSNLSFGPARPAARARRNSFKVFELIPRS
ncbi:hypothetical protein EVAR_82286_1 [Eumeta japonica]|uniref:Uncharacterized protein n=1 Tax=Eumeta variegata TaxID=151549 RepID=A0A4C1W120_EUMVA|nr:hypothetical protein EVAR_82286_1 [Eumeta japonica]